MQGAQSACPSRSLGLALVCPSCVCRCGSPGAHWEPGTRAGGLGVRSEQSAGRSEGDRPPLTYQKHWERCHGPTPTHRVCPSPKTTAQEGETEAPEDRAGCQVPSSPECPHSWVSWMRDVWRTPPPALICGHTGFPGEGAGGGLLHTPPINAVGPGDTRLHTPGGRAEAAHTSSTSLRDS